MIEDERKRRRELQKDIPSDAFLRVGQTVRVRNDINDEMFCVTTHMLKYAGMEAHITGFYYVAPITRLMFFIDIDRENYLWHSELFDPLPNFDDLFFLSDHYFHAR